MTIKDLEPKSVWNNFYSLTQIPRPSKKEGKAIDFMYDFGKSLGLETYRDEIGNVIIRKPATPFVVSDRCTIPDMNLHCGANRLYAVNAVCRVACLAWAGREREADAPSAHGLEHRRYSLERRSAKEDKSRKKLWWKSPRLSKGLLWDCGTD